jgi:hypothetical protein
LLSLSKALGVLGGNKELCKPQKLLEMQIRRILLMPTENPFPK